MLILLLLGVFLAYQLQKKIYERFWDDKLDVAIHFRESHIREGESGALIEEISNDKLLPLTAVEVRIGLSRNLVFSGEAVDNSNISDQSYRRDVFALFSHTRIIRTLPFLGTRRGYYQITRSEVVGSDFFFLKEYHEQRAQQTFLYVYPGITDISRIRLICRTISGSVVRQSRLYPDPFEFSGIREYNRTDPMNHINWKASARMGEIMVNQFDSTTSVELTILLDSMDAGIIRYRELTEEAIRITASLAAELDRSHMDIRIRGNGVCNFQGEKETLSMDLKADCGQMDELNRKLALLDLEETRGEFVSILEKEVQKRKTEHIYLVISKDDALAEKDILQQLSAHQNSVIWVKPYLRQTDVVVPEVRGITVLGWEVER